MPMHELFDQSAKRSIKSTFSVQLIVIVITFTGSAVLGHIVEGLINEQIKRSWYTFSLIIIWIALVLLVTLISWLAIGLASIDRKIGLRVRYVGREESRAVLFRELRLIARQAKSRIVIVNTNISATSEDDSDRETVSERRLYLGTLLERVRNANVTYHRVIQAEDKAALSVFSGERLRHFHEMLDEKARNGSKIGLTRAADARPLTFTLVDDHWLMLEIDQRDTNGLHMEGILIFDDPQQTIIGDFDRYYQSLSLSSNKGSIERGDLPALPSSTDKAQKGESLGEPKLPTATA